MDNEKNNSTKEDEAVKDTSRETESSENGASTKTKTELDFERIQEKKVRMLLF